MFRWTCWNFGEAAHRAAERWRSCSTSRGSTRSNFLKGCGCTYGQGCDRVDVSPFLQTALERRCPHDQVERKRLPFGLSFRAEVRNERIQAVSSVSFRRSRNFLDLLDRKKREREASCLFRVNVVGQHKSSLLGGPRQNTRIRSLVEPHILRTNDIQTGIASLNRPKDGASKAHICQEPEHRSLLRLALRQQSLAAAFARVLALNFAAEFL